MHSTRRICPLWLVAFLLSAQGDPILPTFELQNPDDFRGAVDIDVSKIYLNAQKIIAQTAALRNSDPLSPFSPLAGNFDSVLYTFPPKTFPSAGTNNTKNIVIGEEQVQFGFKTSLQPSATYLTGEDDFSTADIHADWVRGANEESGAFFFMADADVDCDGQAWKCPHNPDGQSETTWGALNAYEVPYTVIPQTFVDSHPGLRKNSLVAVICPGMKKNAFEPAFDLQLFYSILGDTNGDTPEVIGEMSMSLAQACFPNDGLDGGKGHSKLDVLYIPFIGEQSVLHGVTKYTITDFARLRELGDELMRDLLARL